KGGALALDVPQRHTRWSGNIDPAAFRRECGSDAGISSLCLASSRHPVTEDCRTSNQRNRCRICRSHSRTPLVLPVAGESVRLVLLGLGFCHSLCGVRDNTPLCPGAPCHNPFYRAAVVGPLIVLWHSPGD